MEFMARRFINMTIPLFFLSVNILNVYLQCAFNHLIEHCHPSLRVSLKYQSFLQCHQKSPPGYFFLLLMSLFLLKCICSLLFILFSLLHVIYVHNVFCTSVLLLAERISIICSDALKRSCGLAAVLERVLIFKFCSVCGFFSSISTFNDCRVWFGFIYFCIVLFVFLKPAVENKSVWQLEVATL